MTTPHDDPVRAVPESPSGARPCQHCSHDVAGSHDAAGGPAASGPTPDRRGVLRSAGAVAGMVAGAAVLAACGGSPDGGGGSPGGGGSSTPTSAVPVGGAKFFPDSRTVVTQPQAGSFKAFDTTCPHQGCAVSGVEGDQLVCPCHGSHFALATGERVAGPATTGLTPRTITISGSTFTVS